MYRDVKKDTERTLGSLFGLGLGYQQLVDKLQTAESKYGVLKDAAKLVKELAELPGGEETVGVAYQVLVRDDLVHRALGQS